MFQRPVAPGNGKESKQKDNKLVAGAVLDNFSDHIGLLKFQKPEVRSQN